MKKPSKLLALMLAALLAVSALAGCTSDGGNSSKTNSTASSGAETSGTGTLDTSKEVELVLYVISDRPAKQDELDANLNSYLKEKLNCTLKINWIGWAEYANKYPLLFSSGEKFDMAYGRHMAQLCFPCTKGRFYEPG